MVFNNLLAMGVLEEARELLAEKGVDLNSLEDVEDMALGNGGLGRLAACFLDSAATHDIPLDGYGLRYKFGLFRQTFENCRQMEAPDDWTKWGDAWSVRRDDLAVTVPMRTGEVVAVPYDMPVIGLGGRNIGTLRLWQAESEEELNFRLFNEQKYAQASAMKNRAEDITKVLYPNDTLRAGKQMRIKQQYMLVSASLQDMLRQFDRLGKPLEELPSAIAVQLNDTHPAMAIPELIRLLNKRGVRFAKALDIARRVFAYTNHTVMQKRWKSGTWSFCTASRRRSPASSSASTKCSARSLPIAAWTQAAWPSSKTGRRIWRGCPCTPRTRSTAWRRSTPSFSSARCSTASMSSIPSASPTSPTA